MPKSLNEVTLLGNVGQDPDIRATSTGARVANLSIATNTYAGKDDNGQARERTDWHRCSVWGRLVDVAEKYVKKGDRVLVKGEVQYGQYEKNGETRYATTIFVKDLVLLGGGDAGDRDAGAQQGGPPVREPAPSAPDDLPF